MMAMVRRAVHMLPLRDACRFQAFRRMKMCTIA
jgi:hypothetical protein